MSVLGNLALWLALLVGVWGALAGFIGGLQGRPDLAHSARRADVVGAVRGPEGQPALLGHGAVRVRVAGAGAHAAPPRRAAPDRGRRRLAGGELFHLGDAVRPRQPVPAAALHAARRQRPEPAAAESGDGVPSADAVPRLHLDHHPVRVRDRRAAREAPRRRLAGRDPQVDAAVLAVPLDRDLSGHVVGLRGAGVGRLLGLGSRRKRLAPSLAHDDRVPAFGDGPGKARHAQEMEPGADHRLAGSR